MCQSIRSDTASASTMTGKSKTSSPEIALTVSVATSRKGGTQLTPVCDIAWPFVAVFSILLATVDRKYQSVR